MRNRNLHDALRAFALEAAALLRDDQNAGAEIEFELDESSHRHGPALYHYRPLTAKFVSERWRRLRALPTCVRASEALGAGASAYLRASGLRGAESEPALQAMLERLYEDATDLTFPEERFERVYREVERTLYDRSQPATVLVALYGVELEAERVELGDDLVLARGDRTDAPDAAVWGSHSDPLVDDDRREPNALLMLTRELSPDDPLPLEEARDRFRRLLTGLRLWKPGGVALAAVAWRRSGDGVWQPFEIEQTGVPRGEPWVLAEGEEQELRELLSVVGRTRQNGSVAWALSRFEMGCGRRLEAEALSDYLLALRALLNSTADDARSSLALRVAVLCAEDGERKRVQRQMELAQALERFVMGDGLHDDYLSAIGSDSPRTLVEETERHLRALLRDVLCGYLDPDLEAISDDLLLEQEAPIEQPQAIRPEPREVPVPVAERPLPVAEAAPVPDAGVTTEIEAIEAASDEIGVTALEPPQQTQLDWDDPAGYSAPV